MNDDLISRKALLKTLSSCNFGNASKVCDSDGFPTHISIVGVMKIISNQPTAFDKEKVIEELRQEAMYELGIPEKKFNSDGGEYSSYCSISFSQAKRIVEKGGIE